MSVVRKRGVERGRGGVDVGVRWAIADPRGDSAPHARLMLHFREKRARVKNREGRKSGLP